MAYLVRLDKKANTIGYQLQTGEITTKAEQIYVEQLSAKDKQSGLIKWKFVKPAADEMKEDKW